MKKIKKESKLIIIVLAIIAIVLISVIIISLRTPKKENIVLQNGVATENIELKDVEFSEITSSYAGGITTIRAKMHNNSNTAKNLNIEIILKDENGNEVGEMRQNIENVEVGRDKIFITGITGDYSDVKDIEMRVVE